MKSSPTFRVLMAAGLYLLLMGGYIVLQTPQLFAAFAALIMCISLLFWVSEARQQESLVAPGDEPVATGAVENVEAAEPSISAAHLKLDLLKAELIEQYAQFGRDQSMLNSKGLGTWHRKPGDREE